MKVGYYPGCTLKGKAKALDETTWFSVRALGAAFEEIANWSCCGATTPLTDTKIANFIAQTRIMANARDEGFEAIVTTCPFCFSTLKRANIVLREDEIKRRRLNTYLAEDRRLRDYEEPPPPWEWYEGDLPVIHLLKWLKEDIGFDKIREAVVNPLSGMKVVPFYGCQLLRPADALDLCDPENPQIFEEFLDSLSVDVLNFPARIDCCGSYLSIAKPDAAVKASYNILDQAKRLGADTVVVTCPLCFYNLDYQQDEIQRQFVEFRPIPILYMTQLLALALGAGLSVIGAEYHKIDPVPLISKYIREPVQI